MRVLFLGGTRFIGPPAVARLQQAGHTVACFHRGVHDGAAWAALADVERIHGDRTALPAHAARLRAWRPDVVVDMVMRSDTDATLVRDLFAGHAARCVALSSADVYRAFGRVNGIEDGPPEPAPLDEQSPLRTGRYPYRGTAPGADDYDKILGEAVVLGAPELPGVVLRLPMVYGPGDYQYRLHQWLRRMWDGRARIPASASFLEWRCSYAFVDDVARAIALAVEHPRAGGIYNVGESDALSVHEWAQRCAAQLGWTGAIVGVEREAAPAALQGTACDAQPIVLDTARIRRELGYAETVDRHTALAATIAWQQAHPPDWPDDRFADTP